MEPRDSEVVGMEEEGSVMVLPAGPAAEDLKKEGKRGSKEAEKQVGESSLARMAGWELAKLRR